MSMTKGTPLSSQIIWLEERVKELETICLEQKNELIGIKRGQYLKENEKLKEEIATLLQENREVTGYYKDQLKAYHEAINAWSINRSKLEEEIADLKKQIHSQPKKDTRWHPWNVSIVDVPPHGNVIVMLDNGDTYLTHSNSVSWQKACPQNDIVAWKWA